MSEDRMAVNLVCSRRGRWSTAASQTTPSWWWTPGGPNATRTLSRCSTPTTPATRAPSTSPALTLSLSSGWPATVTWWPWRWMCPPWTTASPGCSKPTRPSAASASWAWRTCTTWAACRPAGPSWCWVWSSCRTAAGARRGSWGSSTTGASAPTPGRPLTPLRPPLPPPPLPPQRSSALQPGVRPTPDRRTARGEPRLDKPPARARSMLQSHRWDSFRPPTPPPPPPHAHTHPTAFYYLPPTKLPALSSIRTVETADNVNVGLCMQHGVGRSVVAEAWSIRWQQTLKAVCAQPLTVRPEHIRHLQHLLP